MAEVVIFNLADFKASDVALNSFWTTPQVRDLILLLRIESG